MQWTEKATWAIETGAENEARLLGMKRVGLEHLLLATLADDKAVPARALQNLGVTYQQIRDEMLRLHGLKRCSHCGAVLPHPDPEAVVS